MSLFSNGCRLGYWVSKIGEKNERVASKAACLTVLSDGCHPLLHSGSIINSSHAHYLFCSLLHFDSISFALFSICLFVIPLAGHIIHSLVRFQYVTTMTLFLSNIFIWSEVRQSAREADCCLTETIDVLTIEKSVYVLCDVINSLFVLWLLHMSD